MRIERKQHQQTTVVVVFTLVISQQIKQIIANGYELLNTCMTARTPYLDVLIERAENIVDLILEATRQHLVSLIKYEHLDIASA